MDIFSSTRIIQLRTVAIHERLSDNENFALKLLPKMVISLINITDMFLIWNDPSSEKEFRRYEKCLFRISEPKSLWASNKTDAIFQWCVFAIIGAVKDNKSTNRISFYSNVDFYIIIQQILIAF